MTIIAWDGHTLAADRRADSGGLIRTITKIFRHNDCLLAITGEICLGSELCAWFRNGADPEKYPAAVKSATDGTRLIVVDSGGLMIYEGSGYPVRIEDRFSAFGSGREFATAAMYLGETAQKAVEVAMALSTGCGNGVDTLTLK